MTTFVFYAKKIFWHTHRNYVNSNFITFKISYIYTSSNWHKPPDLCTKSLSKFTQVLIFTVSTIQLLILEKYQSHGQISHSRALRNEFTYMFLSPGSLLPQDNILCQISLDSNLEARDVCKYTQRLPGVVQCTSLWVQGACHSS